MATSGRADRAREIAEPIISAMRAEFGEAMEGAEFLDHGAGRYSVAAFASDGPEHSRLLARREFEVGEPKDGLPPEEVDLLYGSREMALPTRAAAQAVAARLLPGVGSYTITPVRADGTLASGGDHEATEFVLDYRPSPCLAASPAPVTGEG